MHTVEASDQEMADNPEAYTHGRNSIFSLHISGKTAGVCALKEDSDGQFELTKMAVSADFQGRGLGKKLMEIVEAYARDDMELAKIYLLSNTKNEAAIRLYKREGWSVMFEGPHPTYERCDIGMEKIL